jgi:hemerythrin-like domain-containing protein
MSHWKGAEHGTSGRICFDGFRNAERGSRQGQEAVEDFESAEGRERGEIAKTAIQELEIHADLEERLIYPAIRAEVDAADMMNEAIEEHHLVHVLIAELKKLKPGDEKFQAKFSVLSELVKHHIEEEEGEMFPKAEECDIDWESLEASVMKRKETLLAKASGRKTGTRPSRKTIR